MWMKIDDGMKMDDVMKMERWMKMKEGRRRWKMGRCSRVE